MYVANLDRSPFAFRCTSNQGRCVLAFLALVGWPFAALADDPIIRVEEDWELVVNEPDDNVACPQFHTVMSPVDHMDDFFAQVVWNYRETPEFVAGGVQLQAWNGESVLRRRSVGYSELSNVAETITWTSMLELDGATLSFEIKNGNSSTWGSFDKDMRLSSDSPVDDLASYSTAVSIENSCITFGSNRVDSMKIREVRRYRASGAVETDNSPYSVYQSEE